MKWDIINFNINTIVDIVLVFCLFIVVMFVLIKYKFTKVSLISTFCCFAVIILSYIFNLNLLFYICIIAFIVVVSVICYSHIGVIRSILSKFKKPKMSKQKTDKIVDRTAIYNEIFKVVRECSKARIGALITFERHDDLKPLCKNGTEIHAPITCELLMTIFYPGTRLHDGAVIIKDGEIFAASVYYTPTSKLLVGKYGSRHRAAIGISEASDSVTVVVSEETGRISIAYKGELITTTLESFITNLEDVMNDGENNN